MAFKARGHVINMTSGMLQAVRLVAEMVDITYHQSDPEYLKSHYYNNDTWLAAASTGSKYGRNKLAPFYSHTVDALVGKDAMGNVLPFSHREPGSNGHKMGWGEYASTFAPIPSEEIIKNVIESYRAAGGSPNMWKMIEAVAWGAGSGFTGIRTYDDTNSGYQKIESDVSTVVSKVNDYKKDVRDGKLGVLEYNEKIKGIDVGKNNTINGLMTGINEMEKALPNLKGKDKQDVENSLAKLKT